MSSLQPVIIFGPTASGKSEVAEKLCDELNGVIINADSLQVYKGLSLLTAQPSIIEGRHLLYNFLAPNIRCDVFQWLDWINSELDNAQSLGKQPIIVGGTGFYIKALLGGIVQIPEVPKEIYKEGEQFLKTLGAKEMYNELKKEVGAHLPSSIKPEDEYRLLRAWSVFKATGTPLHVLQHQLPKTKPLDAIKILCSQDRENLYDRINRRFIWMWENGIIEEVQLFRSSYYTIKNNFASKAIGFEEVIAYLDGMFSAEEAIMRSQIRTRQYAKRQITWLRHQFTPDVVLEGPAFDVNKVKKFYSNVTKI